MVNQEIRDKLDSDAILLENPAYDNSIIGVTLDGAVIYSYSCMLAEIKEEMSMTYTEADDFVHYNTVKALNYMINKKKPIIVELFD